MSAEPDGCASCHPMRRYVEASHLGKDLDAAHARASVSCTDCHQGYSLSVRTKTALAYAAGAVTGPSRHRYDDAMCNRCHLSMEHLAARTDFLLRNPHRSHWPELACADCHLAHGRQIDFCGGCHDNGGQWMTGDPIVPRLEDPWLFGGQCRADQAPCTSLRTAWP